MYTSLISISEAQAIMNILNIAYTVNKGIRIAFSIFVS